MDKRKGYFLQGRTIPQKFETDQGICLALGHDKEKTNFPMLFLQLLSDEGNSLKPQI